MDFISNFTKIEQSAPTTGGDQEQSSSDLFNSVKVVAGAAQSHISHEPPTYDNAELAGATADLIGAASDYGKLDNTQGLGQYVEQAENYLNEYKTSHTPSPAPTTTTTTETVVDTNHSTTPAIETADTDPVSVSEEKVEKTESVENIPSGGESKVETEELSGKNKEDKAEPDASEVYGTSNEEGTEEDVSKKPSGDDVTTKTDISEESKFEGETEEDLSKKSIDDVYGGKDTEETLPEKPSGDGAVQISETGDKTEGVSEKLPAVGEDVSEKISELSEVGIGKVAGSFFKESS